MHRAIRSEQGRSGCCQPCSALGQQGRDFSNAPLKPPQQVMRLALGQADWLGARDGPRRACSSALAVLRPPPPTAASAALPSNPQRFWALVGLVTLPDQPPAHTSPWNLHYVTHVLAKPPLQLQFRPARPDRPPGVPPTLPPLLPVSP